jgi:hypothetical protein
MRGSCSTDHFLKTVLEKTIKISQPTLARAWMLVAKPSAFSTICTCIALIFGLGKCRPAYTQKLRCTGQTDSEGGTIQLTPSTQR